MKVRRVVLPRIIHDTVGGGVGFALWRNDAYLQVAREWRWTYYLALSVIYELGLFAMTGNFRIKADAPAPGYFEEFEIAD